MRWAKIRTTIAWNFLVGPPLTTPLRLSIVTSMAPETLMRCPYHQLPPSSFWDRMVAGHGADDIDPHLPSKLKISRETRVSSAGSCFAQHISRALAERGYNYVIAEKAPDFLSPEAALRHGYGVFSARYGNVYTTLQLLQLIQRALGIFEPKDQFWMSDKGRCFDLLRPRIMPQGYASRAEAEADSRQHLAAVRRLLKTTDVFIFTLGLTEVWLSRGDGTAYPTCPGCGSAGNYDPERYEFHNLSAAETAASLSSAIDLMKEANPYVQIVLTVSPVPLIATMEQRHVLQATTYSKSVLRVAAEETVIRHPNVHYFASYEIITATRNTHIFVDADGRTITTAGVTRAMDVFFTQFGDEGTAHTQPSGVEHVEQTNSASANAVVCDEEEFFRGLAGHPQA